MLVKNENIVINGSSQIDGLEAINFQAQMASNDPLNMTFHSWQSNPQLYKEHREECREDQAAFEDYAYSIQDELISKMPTATESEGEEA